MHAHSKPTDSGSDCDYSDYLLMPRHTEGASCSPWATGTAMVLSQMRWHRITAFSSLSRRIAAVEATNTAAAIAGSVDVVAMRTITATDATLWLCKNSVTVGAVVTGSLLPASLSSAPQLASCGAKRTLRRLRCLLDCLDCKDLTCIQSARSFDLLNMYWSLPSCSTHQHLNYHTETTSKSPDSLSTFLPMILTAC